MGFKLAYVCYTVMSHPGAGSQITPPATYQQAFECAAATHSNAVEFAATFYHTPTWLPAVEEHNLCYYYYYYYSTYKKIARKLTTTLICTRIYLSAGHYTYKAP